MPGQQQAVNGGEDVDGVALMVEQHARRRQTKMSLSRELKMFLLRLFGCSTLTSRSRRPKGV